MDTRLTCEPIPKDKFLWCNSHGGRVTERWTNAYGHSGYHCDNPGLMIPCSVVDLTDDLEIDR